MIEGCLVLEVRFAEEPARDPARVLACLARLIAALPEPPASIFAATPGGKVSRTRRYKWSTAEKLAADPQTGTIVITSDLERGPATIDLTLFLRHNARTAAFEPPPGLTCFVTDAPDDLVGSYEAVLRECAAGTSVLNGCVTRLSNQGEARSEITGTGTDVEKQSALFQRRRAHDWPFLQVAARIKVRRLYWSTLLGPTLAVAAGGAEAARAAGAHEVQEIGGSLLIRAMPGPPRDSLDPAFLAATTGLRRWLWPHSFQNPLDAAGFEAEVGLPA